MHPRSQWSGDPAIFEKAEELGIALTPPSVRGVRERAHDPWEAPGLGDEGEEQ